MAIHFGTSVNNTNLRKFMISMANQYLNTAETHIVDFTKEKNIKSLSFSSANGGHPYFELDQDLAVTDYQQKYTPQADQWLSPNGVTHLGVFLNELQVAAIQGFMPQFDYIPPHKSMLGSWNAIMKRDIPPYLTIVKQPADVVVDERGEFTIEAICDRPEAHWVIKLKNGGGENDIANGIGTTATYHTNEAALHDAGEYRVVFTEDTLTATSRTATVTVVPTLLVVTVPMVDTVVTEGQALSLTATCNYQTATYSLLHNGVEVHAGNGATFQYDVAAAQLSAAGTYTAVFKYNGQTVENTCNVVIRETPLTVTATSGDVAINLGQNLTVSATVNRANVTWKLFNGAQEIATGVGADASYSVVSSSTLQSGLYRFVFTSSQQEVATRNISVTVRPTAFNAGFNIGFGA